MIQTTFVQNKLAITLLRYGRITLRWDTLYNLYNQKNVQQLIKENNKFNRFTYKILLISVKI